MNPPPCHSRRELEPGSRVFYCAHPRMHAGDQRVTAEVCTVCDLWRQPPPEAFRPFPPRPDRSNLGPCRFLGAAVGLRECRPCRGAVRVKVFACGHPRHAETTLAECARCGDFAERPAEPAGAGAGSLTGEGCDRVAV